MAARRQQIGVTDPCCWLVSEVEACIFQTHAWYNPSWQVGITSALAGRAGARLQGYCWECRHGS